jgi:hypothetical protein
VNTFSFVIKINGLPRPANLRFSTKVELQRYHQNLSAFATDSAGVVREAVDPR